MKGIRIYGDEIHWDGDLVGLITSEVVRHDQLEEFKYTLENRIEPDNDEFVKRILASVGEKLPAPKAGYVSMKDVQKALLLTLEEYME